jgi:hypothetical protein
MTRITDLDPAIKQKLWAEQRLLEAERRRDQWAREAARTTWQVLGTATVIGSLAVAAFTLGGVLLVTGVPTHGSAIPPLLLGTALALAAVSWGHISWTDHRNAPDELEALDDVIEQLIDKRDDADQRIIANEEANRAHTEAAARVKGRLEGLARGAGWPDEDIAVLSSLLDPSPASR